MNNHPEPEVNELIEFQRTPPYKQIIKTVLEREGVRTVGALFDQNPDLVFELHDELVLLRGDTEVVAEFEHDLERETM
jgi:hypothetical protein